MIRTIVLSSLCLGAFAQDAPPEGFSQCPCLGKDKLGLEKCDCTYDWADADGKCVGVVENVSKFRIYPGSYGEFCATHAEPGDASCYVVTANPPYPKPTSEQASWCANPWCYVDPCACEVVATGSSYFKDKLVYSYATCGAANTFLAESENADLTTAVGDAVCKTDGEPSWVTAVKTKNWITTCSDILGASTSAGADADAGAGASTSAGAGADAGAGAGATGADTGSNTTAASSDTTAAPSETSVACFYNMLALPACMLLYVLA